MARNISRRKFVAVLGGAIAWPLPARAQRSTNPIVGFLEIGSQIASATLVAAFRQGLNEVGFGEGQNVTIEYRWANGEAGRLPALAEELMHIPVAVLATGGGDQTARAAKAATATIPIVSDFGDNPVEIGMVASLNRPGGNMTGVNQMIAELVTKQLGLLHELVPQVPVIAMLVNPANPRRVETVTTGAPAAARAIGCDLQVLKAVTDQDIDAAFMTAAKQRIGAFFVTPDPSFFRRRQRIIGLAAQYAIPTLYVRREFAANGGLVSYGTSLIDTYRQVGAYAGRILKGEKPADLPVVQPTKFELVINLKAAKAMGLMVPASLLATADEVIE
jgi:putative tryptophan/tyrosine transport system substrate-binding protein